MKKKLISGLLSLSIALSGLLGNMPASDRATAAQTNWKFDLGGSGAASGFTGVSASDVYNSSKGYGFSGSVSNSSAKGTGANSDSVKFTGGVFNADVPPGLYQITVTTGNSPRTTISIEGMPQMINLTGNNAVESIQVPVTDGQLNIAAVAGKENTEYSISAIEITQLNNTGNMKPTVWICGDSTVANYYNTADTSQHGWGQFLKEYINKDVFEVRNQASSGQYAKGFYEGGQFDAIKTYGKKDDYYIISIGINDTNYSNAAEYKDVVTKMVTQAKQKDMKVILVKQQGRHGDLNRNPLLTGRWFGTQLDEIGNEQSVQVADLFTAWQNFGLSIGGYDAMTPFYAVTSTGTNDDLHQSAKGAKKNAELLQSLIKISENSVTAPVVTEPAGTQVTEPSVSEDVTMGDINEDGKIGILDLILLKNMILEKKDYKTAADINGDSRIDAQDVKIMEDFGLGKDVSFTKPSKQQNVFYAVDQLWEEGVAETVNAGYTSENGYVNLDNTDTSSITFTVNVPEAGNYMTHIRFANGTSDDRPMKIFVNSKTDSYWMQSFPGTGAWTTWIEYGIVLPLTAGINTIKFASVAAGKGGPNLDYISLTPTDEPFAETYKPQTTPPVTGGEKATLFILGDSTVQSYRESYAPQQGWGYYLGNYFSSDITVANHSMAGRSSKKAYDEGRWKTIADSMKKGDYVMIQFAINDAGQSNADRYAPTCGNVNDPAAGSYEWYMTQFITDALAKGGTPILVTTVIGMKAYNSTTGKFTGSYSNYCNACKQLAAKYNIPCIDLNTLMVDHYNSVGYNTALSYHLSGAVPGSTDGTHFCEKGADVVAKLVADATKKLSVPLSKSVK